MPPIMIPQPHPSPTPWTPSRPTIRTNNTITTNYKVIQCYAATWSSTSTLCTTFAVWFDNRVPDWYVYGLNVYYTATWWGLLDARDEKAATAARWWWVLVELIWWLGYHEITIIRPTIPPKPTITPTTPRTPKQLIQYRIKIPTPIPSRRRIPISSSRNDWITIDRNILRKHTNQRANQRAILYTHLITRIHYNTILPSKVTIIIHIAKYTPIILLFSRVNITPQQWKSNIPHLWAIAIRLIETIAFAFDGAVILYVWLNDSNMWGLEPY